MTTKSQLHQQLSMFQTKGTANPDVSISSVKVIVQAPKPTGFVRKVPLINKYTPKSYVDGDNFRLIS